MGLGAWASQGRKANATLAWRSAAGVACAARRSAWLAAAMIAAASAQGARAEPIENVIELFTSQGCSSCPPADRLATRLARDPHMMVLSLAVDYWDFGGWKDTFASPANSARQHAYANVGGRSEVFTPQVVVNGLNSWNGSDAQGIADSAAESHKNPAVLALPLTIAERGGVIEINLGEAPAASPRQAGIYLLWVERLGAVKVMRGENAGAALTFTNVLRGSRKLGEWTGAPLKLALPKDASAPEGADTFAIIVQAGDVDAPSTVLAAAWAP